MTVNASHKFHWTQRGCTSQTQSPYRSTHRRLYLLQSPPTRHGRPYHRKNNQLGHQSHRSSVLHYQDAVANAWITGTTIIADAVCVCLSQMEEIEEWMDDFIRLECSWSCIQNAVDAAVSALRGIFNLMAGSAGTSGLRNLSVSSVTPSEGAEKSDYFTFDMEKESVAASKHGSIRDDLMQIESLDPLYSPSMDDISKMPAPLTLRRFSEAFGISAPAPVAA
ncbi:hypothetical protein K469DRAFT_682064 [Zopfia rhizophila CBS 207.26]|uniref:Uncharacterized protein n=1 Tax=Zopfia rhizophila CBS 207.26 TaxID=1314779 RepID=A0A6A6EX04_9PEZI|nr:hypothetical protein K469DRAFT_682064 [Zopfia rhizophila CBS 207.26]